MIQSVFIISGLDALIATPNSKLSGKTPRIKM
jgi:hypothetical protein